MKKRRRTLKLFHHTYARVVASLNSPSESVHQHMLFLGEAPTSVFNFFVCLLMSWLQDIEAVLYELKLGIVIRYH